MFGYVKIYKPELKIKEYELYKAVYCSLCKESGRRFGLLSRFFLSYDFTFLAIVRMAAEHKGTDFKAGRCAFNPVKKCSYCEDDGGHITFAAAASAIMLYYKIRDDISDSPFIKKLMLYPLYPILLKNRGKAAEIYPQIDRIIKTAMHQQSIVETNKSQSIDEAAHPTAMALSQITAMDISDEARRKSLERLGLCIGRWVYITDAAADIEEDLKNQDYNPFIEKYKLKGKSPALPVDEIRAILSTTVSEAVKAFEALDCGDYDGIIRNIIYDGLYRSFEEILKKED